MSSLVRSASLTHYAEVARSAGLDPLVLLADVGLSPACLHDPDLRIPSDAVRALLEASAIASGLDNFGLRMAETRLLSNLGPVALVVREEPTVRRVVRALVRYSRMLNESLFMRLDEAEGIAVIRDELLVGHAGSSRQAMELLVGVMFRSLKFFLGPTWNPLRVCFAHAPPRDPSLHIRMFGHAVDFGQDFNGLVCTTRDMDAPNPMADPVMARYARQLLDATGGSGSMNAVDGVRNILLVLLPSGQCSIDQVAQQLGVDRRTVHRRLLREGTTFTEVMNTIRRELAAQYIDDGTRPLSQVADLLGFSALSAFSRWYKQQFGEVAGRRRRAGSRTKY
ncbi:AraC family transcriptional regulator [Variovorax sp. WS11]|uniref:AraC family transcriptional regulator n=1 Tax=Variovorax sp. WS11 TaxID=1105204 RepID=UPI000D0E1062|nr:AraC family transcriptional regulator [Variovorax sp. WS11]NDZ13246.1 AraC family transcriptional regulator [Variovorax sp. WS11]PSL82033.1 AraC family transcriptional regulator [Variovorax sp. WS11]